MNMISIEGKVRYRKQRKPVYNNSRRSMFDPCVKKIPWRREWLPTPVFLPREFYRQRNLMGYSPWGRKELDITEWLSHTYIDSKSGTLSFIHIHWIHSLVVHWFIQGLFYEGLSCFIPVLLLASPDFFIVRVEIK